MIAKCLHPLYLMNSIKPVAMLASEASGRMKVGNVLVFDNLGEVEAVEI